MKTNSSVIGIDGLGGSGKTTFSIKLQRSLGDIHLFHLDDFIHPKHIRYDNSMEEWEAYYHKQWRYDYLIEKLLTPLKSGLGINDFIEFYDKETDQYHFRKITVPAGERVIFEGVFLQRQELREYFDVVIYLDVHKANRLERILNRDNYIGDESDILNKYDRRYFPAEEMYLKEVEPMRHADKIITEFNEEGDQLCNFLL